MGTKLRIGDEICPFNNTPQEHCGFDDGDLAFHDRKIKIDIYISVRSWDAISLWFEKNKRTGCITRRLRPSVNRRYDKRRDDNGGNEFPLPPHKANHFTGVEPALSFSG